MSVCVHSSSTGQPMSAIFRAPGGKVSPALLKAASGCGWSHVGWAYKDGEAWRVVHKLNQCGTPRGDLYRQGLAEFFLDDLVG